MSELAEKSPYSTGTVYNCTCGWIVTDTGSSFRPRRVRENPKCPIHGVEESDQVASPGTPR